MRPILVRDVPEPELRYLRRRGNLRVHKLRLRRSLLRSWKTVLLNITAAGLATFSVARGVDHLFTSPTFALRFIEVHGTHRTTPDAVRGLLRAFVGRNLFELNLDEIADAAEQDPWVRSASVKKVLPRSLRLEVVERTPGALALIHGSIDLVDETGERIGAVGPGIAEDLPIVRGLDGLEQEALTARLRVGVAATRVLRESAGPWFDEISELDVSLPDRIVAWTRTPGPSLWLDPREVQRNLGSYLISRAEIDRRVGPLEYVDLRWRDRMLAMPAPPARTESE